MILVVGVGNTLRSDDGIGALITQKVSALGWHGVETQITQQLHLEAIEDFKPFEKVIIIDAAYTGVGFEFKKINLSITSSMSSSHHLSLELLLALAKKLYQHDINLYLCSIKGESFEIGNTISPEVLNCVPLVIEKISSLRKMAMQIDIFGIVQGVGFRPYIFNSLSKLNFLGTIQNRGNCVRLVLEAELGALLKFINEIKLYIPPLARIENINQKEISIQNFTDLQIVSSEKDENFDLVIPPDLRTCPDCFKEFFEIDNRRKHYPFITCTNCGPRYSIVETVPYDRSNTSMKSFPLCEECLKEYNNPRDRRFHAESIACSKCGPILWLEDPLGKQLTECGSNIECLSELIIGELKKGKIIAVRALGGFQLICDARNKNAVKRLREKKLRPNQSFALMAPDMETIKRECLVDQNAEKVLLSAVSPILILEVKENSTLPMEQVAPDLYTVGVMLPTTPTHQLLFGLKKNNFDFLIVTSGNAHGEPIAISNNEARKSLTNIADFFLLHNRDILRRVDDSIATINNDQIQYWRSARGQSPNRLKSSVNNKKHILALGAELKNTITLAFDNSLITSPHLGNLDNPVSAASFIEMCEALPKFYQKNIELIVVDKHAGYFSSQYGKELASKLNIPCIDVQHHHAHAMAVMAEYNLDEAIAIIFDGTGLGDDNTLWGGELLEVGTTGYSRLGHLMPFRLPGGASAITSPWRVALAFCDYLSSKDCAKIFCQSEEDIDVVRTGLKKEINCPLSSSIGRLFDAVSAVLQIAPQKISYEAEAAIRLETIAQKSKRLSNVFSYQIVLHDGKIIIDPRDMMRELLELVLTVDKLDQVKFHKLQADLAYRFHLTVANMVLDFSRFALERSSAKKPLKIVLSGGVFQNKLLLNLSADLLKSNGISPIISNEFSPGDGQISLGQAHIARFSFN